MEAFKSTLRSGRMLAGLAALCLVPLIPAPAQAAMSLEEIALYKGPDRMKILEEGAKKEGQVVMYGTLSPENAIRPLTAAWQKKYPSIEFRNWTGTTGEIMPKVMAERRTNSQVADVLEWAEGSVPAIKAGAVIPFWLQAMADIPEQYYDAKGYWVAPRVSYFGIGYNTKQIGPNDVPKVYEDLIDPKYKNKLVWRAGSEPGAPLFISNIRRVMGEEKAEDFLKKLSAQNVVNYTSGSAVALVNVIGQGEYAMGLNIFANNPIQAAQKGAPTDVKMMDPSPTTVSTFQIVKNAPHPHAALLFAEFLMSPDGQSVLRDVGYFPPNRKVEPDPTFAKAIPRMVSVKENTFSPELMVEMSPRSNELWDKYFR
jgi:iron(III) transport system substrate-binding protein